MVAPASYLCSLASFARSSSSLRSRPAKSGTRRSDSVASVLTAIDSSCVLSATLRYRTQWLRAEVRGLELVAEPPDAVDVAAAARVDAVTASPRQPLIVGGEDELWIMQLVEVGAKQGGA